MAGLARKLKTEVPIPVDRKLQPGCLFLTTSRTYEKQIRDSFQEGGYRIEYLKSLEELQAHLKNPRNYLVLVDAAAYPDAVRWLGTLGDLDRRRFFWVVVARFSKTSQSSRIYQMGASDILTPPVHPTLARGRAQLFLKRFLNNFDFPEGTVLPKGVLPPNRDNGAIRLVSPVEKVEAPAEKFVFKIPIRRKKIIKVVDAQPTAGGEPALKVRQQQVPFRHRYTKKQLRVIESIHDLFRFRSGRFVAVKSAKDLSALFGIASMQKCPVTVWSREPKVRMDTSLAIYQEGKKQFELKLSSQTDAKKLAGRWVFCQFFLELSSVFFVAKLSVEDGRVRLLSPQKVYQVQRRGSFRMDVPRGMNPKADLVLSGRNSVDGDIIDLSSTGMQLGITAEAMKELVPFARVKIRFEAMPGIHVNADCQIRWRAVKKNRPAVGLMFLNLPPKLRDEIAFRIYEHYSQSLEGIFKV